MADDLDVDTFQYLLGQALLPNIQRTIVNQGIHFRNFFVTNPLCSPSRASFLTGRYPHRHGVLTNTPVSSGSPPGSIEAFGNPTVLPGWLSDPFTLNYVTAHIGKYLSFYGSGTDPAKPIFLPFVPQGWTKWRGLKDFSTYQYYDFTYRRELPHDLISVPGNPGVDPPNEHHQTDTLVVATPAEGHPMAEEIPGLFGGPPVFLGIFPLAPHADIMPEQRSALNGYSDIWNDDVDPPHRYRGTRSDCLFGVCTEPPKPNFNETDDSDKPLWVRAKPQIDPVDRLKIDRHFRHRLEAMQAVDDLVATVIDEWLSNPLIAANTWVIFTSDHGYFLGEHKLGGKGAAYEEAIRAPLYVLQPAGPQRAPGVRDHLVTNLDLAPTILEIAGATNVEDTYGLDGKSFLPVINNPVANPPSSWRKRFLVEHWPEGDQIQPVFDIPRFDATRTLRFDSAGNVIADILYVDYADASQTDEFYNHLRACPYPSGPPDVYQLCSLDPAFQAESAQLGCFLNLLRQCGNSPETKCRDIEFMDTCPSP